MRAKKYNPMNVEEFLRMEFDNNHTYELIDGIVLMSPRPSRYHNIVQSNVVTAFITS